MNFILGEVVIDLLKLLELFFGDRSLLLLLNSLAEVIHLSYI